MTKLLLVFFLWGVILTTTARRPLRRRVWVKIPEGMMERLEPVPYYTHLNEGCVDKCPLSEGALCVLDCHYVYPDGTRNDCIYNHYNRQTGKRVFCWGP